MRIPEKGADSTGNFGRLKAYDNSSLHASNEAPNAFVGKIGRASRLEPALDCNDQSGNIEGH